MITPISNIKKEASSGTGAVTPAAVAESIRSEVALYVPISKPLPIALLVLISSYISNIYERINSFWYKQTVSMTLCPLI